MPSSVTRKNPLPCKSDVVIAGGLRRECGFPTHHERSCFTGLRRWIAQISDDRLRARGDGRRLRSRTQQRQHILHGVVARLGPRFAIGGQQICRHRRRFFRQKLCAGHKMDLRSGQHRAHAFQHRHGMRGNSVVIAQQYGRLLRQWTNERNFHARSLQRKHAVIFQQHHRLIGQLERQRAMLRRRRASSRQSCCTAPCPADRTCPASCAR